MALIDPVEALENAALVLRRDADAGVLHGHDRAVRCAVDGHIHAAALTVILDGVVTEVIDDLRSKPADGRDLPVVSMDADRDLLFRRSAGQRGGRLLGQLFQIDRLERKLPALVQLRQADDVLNERHKTRRLGADMADKARHVLLLHEAVFDQLRAAHDGLERRFQLVGNICCEFAAIAFGKGLLRHVKRQQHRADDRALRFDTADIELILASAALHTQLRVALLQRTPDGAADLMAPFNGQEILSDTVRLRMEQRPCRRVDAQHRPLFVHQDEAFVHARRDLVEFVLLLLERAQLRVDLAALLIDAREQRRKLLIGIVFQRLFQIETVERRDDPGGDALCQNKRQNERRHQHDQHRLEHPHHKHARRGAADRNTQDGAVRQLFRVVDRLFQKRAGIAGALPLAALERLPDLLALGMIFHAAFVGLRVKQHLAGRRDPRQAVALPFQRLEIGFSAAFHARLCQRKLVLELTLLNAAEIVIQAAHDDEHTAQKHDGGRRHDGQKDFSCHGCTSNR